MSREKKYNNGVIVVSVILIALGSLVMFLDLLTQQWWFVPALVLIGVVTGAILVWSIVQSKDRSRRGMM